MTNHSEVSPLFIFWIVFFVSVLFSNTLALCYMNNTIKNLKFFLFESEIMDKTNSLY